MFLRGKYHELWPSLLSPDPQRPKLCKDYSITTVCGLSQLHPTLTWPWPGSSDPYQRGCLPLFSLSLSHPLILLPSLALPFSFRVPTPSTYGPGQLLLLSSSLPLNSPHQLPSPCPKETLFHAIPSCGWSLWVKGCLCMGPLRHALPPHRPREHNLIPPSTLMITTTTKEISLQGELLL